LKKSYLVKRNNNEKFTGKHFLVFERLVQCNVSSSYIHHPTFGWMFSFWIRFPCFLALPKATYYSVVFLRRSFVLASVLYTRLTAIHTDSEVLSNNAPEARIQCFTC
jgi:hypothetical protein